METKEVFLEDITTYFKLLLNDPDPLLQIIREGPALKGGFGKKTSKKLTVHIKSTSFGESDISEDIKRHLEKLTSNMVRGFFMFNRNNSDYVDFCKEGGYSYLFTLDALLDPSPSQVNSEPKP